MAKRVRKTTRANEPPAEEDLSPEDRKALDAAEEAMAAARETLRKAQDDYAKVREKARHKMKGLREKNLGELVDDTLGYVQEHPALGVLGALFVGLFLGRLFRR